MLGQLQHFDEALGEQRPVFPAEGAERVVVGMGVGSEQTHRDAVVSALLDATAAEGARGIAVNKQAQQHGRRILFAAGAAEVDLDLTQVQGIHRVEDEVDQMIGGHPVAKVRWQKQRGITVNDNEAGGHVFQTPVLRCCSIRP